MKLHRHSPLPLFIALLACAPVALAQSFSSGSTGADGALNLTSGGATTITVRPGGVYNYTTVNISSGVTYLRGTDNAPIVILATGDVTISGTIELSGASGVNTFNQGVAIGGLGGPGGFNGGNSALISTNPPINIPPTAGQGPGGGVQSTGAGGGQGTYGASTAFVSLTPLFGGSGGGGGQGLLNSFGFSSNSGAGGGGGIVIASSTRITLTGTIRANGGNGQGSTQNCPFSSGAGAGGAIRLVAPEIRGTGTIQAIRGNTVGCNGSATDGRIRLEAFTLSGYTGTTIPVASVSNSPGGTSPAGNPQLTNVPTLAITSVGGVAVPGTTAASYSAPDITLAAGASNPVAVQLAATNTPVGSPTVITVRVAPQGSFSTVTVAPTDHVGTFASSTATANVTLPVGQVTVLQANAAMTLTGQQASLFPQIDGEPVERVMVAATPGERSSLSLVTKSGREVLLDKLPAEQQQQFARAWDALKGTN